jgi:hypothetical protein
VYENLAGHILLKYIRVPLFVLENYFLDVEHKQETEEERNLHKNLNFMENGYGVIWDDIFPDPLCNNLSS